MDLQGDGENPINSLSDVSWWVRCYFSLDCSSGFHETCTNHLTLYEWNVCISSILREVKVKAFVKKRKKQKFILSQIWQLEVQNQGVRKSMLTPKALGDDLSFLFTLAFSTFWWFQAFLGLWSHHSNLWLHDHIASSSSARVYCQDIFIRFRDYLDNPAWSPYLKIFNLYL